MGFMHYRDAQGNDEVEFAKEPSGLSPAIDPLTLSLDRLLPALSEEQTPRVTFVNGFGMPFKLKDVLNDLFKDYPDKPFHQGGEQLEKRKGQWRGALVRALNSPTVLLLSTFNSVYRAQGATLIEVREAWLGESPAWEVRHDQTFYAPYSAYRPLIDALLVGHDHDEVRPHADDNTPLDLPVLFEDEYCVVVNKPSRLSLIHI